jgi:hypothetical protein
MNNDLNNFQPINGYVQVYQVWISGRDINDNNQHHPIVNENVDKYWHTDFKQASEDYINVIVNNKDKHGLYSDIYKDYIVQLFSIDINIEDFENTYNLEFDLNNEYVQEAIPYYVDYDFHTVAERVSNFN